MGKISVWVAAAVLLTAVPVLANNAQTTNSSNVSNNNWAAMRGFDPALDVVGSASHPDTGNVSAFLSQSTQFGYGLAAGTSDQDICQQRVGCDFTANTDGFPEGGNGSLSALPDPFAQTGNAGYYFLSYMEGGSDPLNPEITQGLKNDAESYAVGATDDCGAIAALSGQARCNQIDYGFAQELQLVGGLTTGTGAGAGGVGTGGTQMFDLFFSVDALVDANGAQLGDAVGTFSLDNPGGAGTCTGSFTRSDTGVVTVTGTAGTYTLAGGRTSGNCP